MIKAMASQTPEKKNEIRSMLVIHQGALGDFILALPTLEILRKSYPEARSVFLGYPRILQLVEKRFYADEVLSVDQRGMASFFAHGGTLDPNLSHFFKTFDMIVVFGKDGGGRLIGNLERICQGRIVHINPFPPWDERVHLTEHLSREFSRHGFPIVEVAPRLHLIRSDEAWGREFWRKNGVEAEERSRVIILHPGSGSKKKIWPLDRFLSLTGFLRKRLGSRVLIVLGPAEGMDVQKAFEEMEWDMGASAPLLAKGLSLLQLASVMKGCRAFIGNDSGVSHMAAALGLPTITIFGPTDPKVWSPKGEKVGVVWREIPCSPCSQERFFLCRDFDCLKGVNLGDVLRELKNLGVGI